MPLDKRIDHVLRSVRLINETDRFIEATIPSDDRKTAALGRAALRVFFGKSYPQDPAKQRTFWEIKTAKDLAYLKAKKRQYEAAGDEGNLENVKEKIKELEDLRKKHLRL